MSTPKGEVSYLIMRFKLKTNLEEFTSISSSFLNVYHMIGWSNFENLQSIKKRIRDSIY